MTILDAPNVKGYVLESDIKQTLDSGYVILGQQKTAGIGIGEGSDLTEITIKKLDKNGVLQWNKNYGRWKNNYQGDEEIQITKDSGFIVCGGVAEVFKIDALGNVQWAKAYGYFDGIYPYETASLVSIQQTKDGGYIAAGTTDNFGEKGGPRGTGVFGLDIYLVKLSSVGNVQWAKTYGNTTWHEQADYVRQTKDGGFVISGVAEQPNASGGTWVETSGFLLKTDSVGKKKWSKYYGVQDPSNISNYSGVGEIRGWFNNAEETPDGGYVAAGWQLGIDNYGTTIIKVNSTGNIQWNKTYNIGEGCGFGHQGKVYPTADGGYALGGISGTCSSGSIFKLDANGNIKWMKDYGAGDYYNTSKVIVTNDLGYALFGYTLDTIVNSYYNPKGFNYIAKLDSLGKNDDCQVTKIGIFSIPTLFTDNLDLTAGVASYSLTLSYAATTYSLYSHTNICLKIPLKATIYKSTTCDKDSVSFGGTNGLFYSWNFGDPTGLNNISSIQNPKHLYPGAGSYTVTLVTSDDVGGSDDTAITIKVLSREFITVSNDVSICSGDSALIKSFDNGPEYYSLGWSPNDNLRSYNDTNIYAHPTKTTQYTFTSNNGGCFDSDSLIVTVVPQTIPTIHGNTTICAGTVSTLSATGANNYLWSTGETSANIEINLNTSSSFSVTTFNGACSSTSTINITVLPSYTVNAGNNITITNGSQVTLNGTSGGTLNWSPSFGLECTACPNPKANPSVTTTYYLTVESAGNKCTTIDSITIYVINCSADIVVPNAFSPNGDNVNDFLVITGNDCIQSYNINIFDRWGEQIVNLKLQNVNGGIINVWDGTYKNKLMNAAVFVYSITATGIDGETISKKGNVSLIR